MAYSMQITLRKASAALVLSALAALVSASSSSGCRSAPFCQGGFTRTVNGMQTCEGVCDPSKCATPKSVCVDNLCASPCTSQPDCGAGEDCVAVATDGPDGHAGMGPMAQVCRINGRS